LQYFWRCIGVDRGFRGELEEDRKRRLEDIIRYARWEAEMTRRLGAKWFEMRDA